MSARTPGRRGRGAALAGAVLALGLRAAPAAAQTDSAAAPAAAPASAALGWGKWAAAAFAAGFTALGIEQHNDGNAAFRSLIRYCGQIDCTLTPGGQYADAAAEATYRHVVHYDRAARAWLVAGQVTAVGTAVLFVVDLMRPSAPPNIPYSGLLVDARDGVTRLGVRIPLGRATR